MLFIFVDGTACTEDGIQLYTKGPQKGHINSSTFHYRFYSVFVKRMPVYCLIYLTSRRPQQKPTVWRLYSGGGVVVRGSEHHFVVCYVLCVVTVYATTGRFG